MFPSSQNPRNYHPQQNETTTMYPDVSDALKFCTESLLHSKTRRKKRKTAPKESVVIQDQIAATATDSSGSSWSNIPRCLNTVQTTSMLSSDAGISSMPSSMISNISETEHHTLNHYNSQQHQEIIIKNNF